MTFQEIKFIVEVWIKAQSFNRQIEGLEVLNTYSHLLTISGSIAEAEDMNLKYRLGVSLPK